MSEFEDTTKETIQNEPNKKWGEKTISELWGH